MKRKRSFEEKSEEHKNNNAENFIIYEQQPVAYPYVPHQQLNVYPPVQYQHQNVYGHLNSQQPNIYPYANYQQPDAYYSAYYQQLIPPYTPLPIISQEPVGGREREPIRENDTFKDSDGNALDMNRQLFDAIRTKNIGKAKALIKEGADVNFVVDFKYEYIEGDNLEARDEPGYYKGDTFLTVATRTQCIDIVKALIEAGADVNAKSFCEGDGRLALTYAVLHKDIEIVKCLLSAGSEVNYEDPYGDETPLEMAEGAPEIRELLIKHGAIEPREESSFDDYSYKKVNQKTLLSSSDMIADHEKLQKLIDQVQLLQSEKGALTERMESQNQMIIMQQTQLEQQQIQMKQQQEQINRLIEKFKIHYNPSENNGSMLPDVLGEEGEVTAMGENNNPCNDLG